jgi:hypothetical protein
MPLRRMGEWIDRSTFFLDLGTSWKGVVSSRPGRFTPDTHWIGGWVGPRAALVDVEKRTFLTLTGLELRPLGRPARLRYPGLGQLKNPMTCRE